MELYLKQGCVVHHINKLRYDNRIENLKVFEGIGPHTSFHNSERKPSDIHRKSNNNIKHTLPLISLGKSKLGLLRYMSYSPKERLNIKKYSREHNMPRSTVYYMLETLQKEKMIEKEGFGCFKITPSGISYVDVTNGAAGSVSNLRTECQDRSVNLSTHYLKYSVEIKEKSKYFEDKLMELNPLKIKELQLKNLKQTYLYFDDATIIINPKKVIVRIHDIVAEEAEDANLETFNKALGYIEKLEEIGLKGDTMELEPGHYARIDSLLAGFLEKVDGRYFLDLGNGRKFWIDHSPPNKIEDETNDIQARERLDSFLKDVMNTDSTMSDIDKIVNALGFMTKIEAARMHRDIGTTDERSGLIPKEKPNYFG